MCDVRENLRAIILNGGYKQSFVAKKTKLTPAKLSGILNKTRKLDANEMFVLCAVLGVTPQQLSEYKPTG